MLGLLGLSVSVAAYAKDLLGATQTSYGVSPSGAFSFQIPIVVPAGRNGVQPNLSLSFSSGQRDGYAGVGWGVSGLSSISRCGRTIATDQARSGVQHNENDRFCLNGKRLIKLSPSGSAYGAAGNEYRTEIDEISKVVSYETLANIGSGSAPKYFKVWGKGGRIFTYGQSANSRFTLPGTTSTHTWMLTKVEDHNGNNYTVTYIDSFASPSKHNYPLPSEIAYQGGHKVTYHYEDRPDTRERFILGKKIFFEKRLSEIEVTRGTTTLRQYKLAYFPADALNKSKLASVRECGLNNACMPKIEITWQDDLQGFDLATQTADQAAADMFSNGLITAHFLQGQTIFGTTEVCQTASCTRASFAEVNHGAWVDVNGDGRVDQVIAVRFPDASSDTLQTYLGSTAGLTTTSDWKLPKALRNYDDDVVNHPNGRFSSSVLNQGQLIDVNGDGLIDVVYAYKYYTDAAQSTTIETVRETYINNGVDGWDLDTSYQPKAYGIYDYTVNGFGNNRMETVTSRLIDVNGDGLPDWVTAYFNYISTNSTTGVISHTIHTATYLNNGNGWDTSSTSSYELPDYFAEYRSLNAPLPHGDFVDVNGDGLVDWVQAYRRGQDPLVASTWLNNGSGFDNNATAGYRLNEAIYDNTSGWDDKLPVKRGSFVDVTGDGLPDFVRSFRRFSNNVEFGLKVNTGAGWQPVDKTDPNDPYRGLVPEFEHTDFTFTDKGRGWAPNTTGFYIDINRDGRTDFVQSYKTAATGNQVYKRTWLNDGAAWQLQASNSIYTAKELFYDHSARGQGVIRHTQFMDLNFDGAVDMVSAGNGERLVRHGKLTSRYRLKDITTTAGVKIKPTFSPLTQSNALYQRTIGDPESDASHVSAPIYVTSGLAVTNAIGGDNTTTYKYSGAQSHRLGRGFLGFKTFTSSDDSSELTRETVYHQDYPFIGRVKTSLVRETSVTDATKWLSKSSSTYLAKPLNSGKTTLPHLHTQTTQTRELDDNGAAQLAWSKQTSTLDNYANSDTNIVERGLSVSNVLHRTEVNNTYLSVQTPDWLVNRVDRVVSTVSEPQVSNSSIVRTTKFVFDSDREWLLKSVIREPEAADTSLTLTTTYGYDNYGNILTESQTSMDPSPMGSPLTPATVTRTSTIGYDNDERLPVSLENALQQTSAIGYHDFCDAPDSVKDINQIETTYVYDDFCRQREVVDAIGVKTTTDYKFTGLSCASCQITPEFSVETTRDGEEPIEVFYSHYAQSLLSRTKGMAQGFGNYASDIEQQTYYDDRGRVAKQSQPYFVGDAQYWNHRVYDKISRLTLNILPYDGRGTSADHPLANQKAIVEYDYAVESGRQKRTVIDQLSQIKTVFANALGQVAEIRDHNQSPLSYDYSALGNLIETVAVDNANNRTSTTTIGYDLLGRRKTLNDPSLGSTSYTYDSFGQMRTQTDANSHMLAMRYDDLGRLRERDVPLENGTIETSVWTYDVNLSTDPAAKALGRISSIKRGSTSQFDERLFYYDDLGRPSSQRTWVRGQRFDEALTYNAYGRLHSRAYPSSGATNGQDNVFAVAYEYDNGYLKEISGLDNAGQKCITHWQADKYDALGRTQEDTLGKIVKTTRDYDPAQGVLRSIQSVLQHGAGAMVQDLSYVYDGNNNVSGREDHTTAVVEAFTYDHLDRLKTHTRTLNAVVSQVSVTYDALGNIRSKSDVGSYKYADPSKPYTLTSVESGVSPSSVPALDKFEVDWQWGDQAATTQAQANIHDSTYEYDANGSIQKQGDRRVYWTAFDKPHTMVRVASDGTQRGSTIDYNADFERNFKQERTFNAFGIPNDTGTNKQTTYYVGKDYEKIFETDGTIKHRYTISTGGGAIQIERLDGSLKDQPKYLLVDNLGSTNVILNALGEVEQRLEFDPWGMRVAGPDVGVVNSITNKGYTGHEMDDEVGLINMNARIYDPYLGRFLSADPVLPDAFNMQSFNRYSYVRNNPLKYIDPAGNSDEPIEEVIVEGETLEEEDSGGGKAPGTTTASPSGGGSVGGFDGFGDDGGDTGGEEEVTPEDNLDKLSEEAQKLEELRRKIRNLQGIASRLNQSLRDDFEKGLDKLQFLLDSLFSRLGQSGRLCSSCGSFNEINVFFRDNLPGVSGTINDALKHALGTREAILLNLLRGISPIATVSQLNAIETVDFNYRTFLDSYHGLLGREVPVDRHPGSRTNQGLQDIRNNRLAFAAFVNRQRLNIRDLFIFSNNGEDVITIGSGDF
jgi:RHS repeat-associated protein